MQECSKSDEVKTVEGDAVLSLILNKIQTDEKFKGKPE